MKMAFGIKLLLCLDYGDHDDDDGDHHNNDDDDDDDDNDDAPGRKGTPHAGESNVGGAAATPIGTQPKQPAISVFDANPKHQSKTREIATNTIPSISISAIIINKKTYFLVFQSS